MEKIKMDIACFLINISFVCNIILCAGISWTKYTIHDTVSEYACTPSWTISSVLRCGRMCYLADKCLSYWYQPSTRQCFTYQACKWTRMQNAIPGMLIYPAVESWVGEYAIHHENSYYFLASSSLLTFDQALDVCNRHNASVVQPETPQENKFLKEFIVARAEEIIQRKDLDIWLGITDIRKEGTWEFRSSWQPLNYSDWRLAEPNNENNAEHCAAYSIVWNGNVPCKAVNLAVCEKRIEE